MPAKFHFSFLALLSALVLGTASLATSAQTAAELMAGGDQEWAAGKLDQAEDYFKRAVAADPGSVPANMKLAGLQLSRQQFAAGIASYQRTIGLDAGNDKAWLGLGFCYLHTGKNELALAAFNRAISIAPSRQQALQPLIDKLLRQ